jgi:hypothetical protein
MRSRFAIPGARWPIEPRRSYAYRAYPAPGIGCNVVLSGPVGADRRLAIHNGYNVAWRAGTLFDVYTNQLKATTIGGSQGYTTIQIAEPLQANGTYVTRTAFAGK